MLILFIRTLRERESIKHIRRNKQIKVLLTPRVDRKKGALGRCRFGLEAAAAPDEPEFA